MTPSNVGRTKWLLLAAMGGVIGVILLDETVVAVALPTIQHDLGMSIVGSHWVINVYLLGLAGLSAAAGRMGDIIGIKLLILVGLAIFGLASFASGFAQDGAWIITARAFQGVGAPIIFPASMAIVTIIFPAEQRGMALGIYGAIGTTFLALGPLVGGAFTDFLSWRWIFWINPPIVVIISLAVMVLWTDPPRSKISAKFDTIGLVSLISGMGMIIFAIMQSSDWGWSATAVWLVLVVGIITLVGFVIHEYRTPSPLIEVRLFANATVSACNLVLFTAQFTKIAVIVFGALYFQHILGYSAFLAGLALLPAVGIQPLVAIQIGPYVPRVGTRLPALIGLGVSAVALIWIGISVAWENYFIILPALVIWASMMGLLFLPALRAVPNAVPIDKQGQSGGIVMSSQLLGGTVAMAVCSSLYAISNDFGIVFFATGGLVVFTMAVSWIFIKPNERAG